ALMSRDIADGTERRRPDFTGALGNRVRHGEDLVGVLVEQQVVIAKVPPADVPVKVLRLQIKREDVGKHSAQVARYLLDRIPAQICSGCCLVLSHRAVLLSGYGLIMKP